MDVVDERLCSAECALPLDVEQGEIIASTGLAPISHASACLVPRRAPGSATSLTPPVRGAARLESDAGGVLAGDEPGRCRLAVQFG